MKSPGRLLITMLLGGVVAVSAEGIVAFNNPTEQQQPQQADPESAEIYQQKCAMCHENPVDRVPPRFLIARRSAEDVIQTLTTGAMKQQAAGLSADQIRALAIYLTGKQPGAPVQANLEANL